jgi:hypothetical protein
MSNSLIDAYRQQMAAMGQPDTRDDFFVMQDLIEDAKANPELLDKYPDFAAEYHAQKVAGTSVGGEFVKGLKSGTEGLGATVAGLGALVGVPGAAEEAKKLEQESADSAPVVSSSSDVSSVGDAARYVAGKAGEFLPGVGEMVGTAAAGAALGSAVEPGAGTLVGAGEGAAEELLGRGIIKKAIREAVDKGLIKGSEEEVAAAIRAGDQAVADKVTQVAKQIAAGRAGEATNLANLYGQSAAGIYNETGDRGTALELGVVGAAAGAIPGISLPRQVVQSLFPKLSAEAANAAVTRLVGEKAGQLLSKAGMLVKGTAGGTAGMVGMEAANIVAKNLTSGKDALELDDSDWKRLREAAVGGALASAPFAALTLRTPAVEPAVAPKPAATLGGDDMQATQDPNPGIGGQPAAPNAPDVAAGAAPAPSPLLEMMSRVKAYTPDEARARLRQLSANTSRDETEEKEYQILRANAPAGDLPAPTQPIKAEAPPGAPRPVEAVPIGARNPEISTGNGIATPTENAIVAKMNADIATNKNSDIPSFKEAGFESEQHFRDTYAREATHDSFETEDEYLRRRYCQNAA